MGSVGSAASSGSPQNTPPQILVIEYRVSRLTATATANGAQARWSRPAWSTASLATNPENGGTPARLSAGSRNSQPRIG